MDELLGNFYPGVINIPVLRGIQPDNLKLLL